MVLSVKQRMLKMVFTLSPFVVNWFNSLLVMYGGEVSLLLSKWGAEINSA
jgi:hypothetical protein